MSDLFFPDIQCVREAFTRFRPDDLLLFYKETDIKPYFVGAFIRAQAGSKRPPYSTIVKIIQYLSKTHGVTFLPNGSYTVK